MLKSSIACVLVLLVAAETSSGSKQPRTQAIVRTLHVVAPEKDQAPYQYVPFQVPPHTHRINISYEYDRANGTNALDLGLFDPRFNERARDLTGFRGWSGGRRSEIF